MISGRFFVFVKQKCKLEDDLMPDARVCARVCMVCLFLSQRIIIQSKDCILGKGTRTFPCHSSLKIASYTVAATQNLNELQVCFFLFF